MVRLTREERRIAIASASQHLAAIGAKKDSMRTVKVLVLRRVAGDGIQLELVAVRRGEAKPVVQWRPEWKSMRFRDIDTGYGMMGAIVDWRVKESDRKFDETGDRPYLYSGGYFTRHLWLSSDEDGEEEWNGDTVLFSRYDCVANPDVLKDTRYRYCGWTEERGPNLFWCLYKYHRNPKVEMLVKAGLLNLVTDGKMRDLERDRGLLRFVARNRDSVRNLAWADVKWMYRTGSSEEAALRRAELRRDRMEFFRHAGRRFPVGIDREAAYAYCRKRGVNAGRYAEAIVLAVEEGLDVRSRAVCQPRDFAAFYAERKRNEAIRYPDETRRSMTPESRMALAKRDERIAAFVKELNEMVSKLDTGSYKIVWLTSQDEFAKEGKSMNNCIGMGSYSMSMSKRDCVCLVLASKGERVDIEIDSGWNVRQCHTNDNLTASKEAWSVAKRIAAKLKKAYAKAA